MQRLWEILLGLDRGFLSREGEFALSFNPRWPWQDTLGAGSWNFVLFIAAVALVVWVYRREGRSRPVRIVLGALRLALLLFVIALLNRPVVTLAQSRTEPSVLAVMIDNSISMRVPDAGETSETGEAPLRTRLSAALDLLNAKDQAFLKELAGQHQVRVYRFDREAHAMGTFTPERTGPTTASTQAAEPSLAEQLAALEPVGQNTQVLAAIRNVLDDLQGQRLAGVVVLTDGRETPARAVAEQLAALKSYNVKVYPVAVGSERPPRNIEVQAVSIQDTAFVNDVVNARVMLRASGFGSGHPVRVILKDKRTGQPLIGMDGTPAEATVEAASDAPFEMEVQFRPTEIGTLDVAVEAVEQAGELDLEDNVRVSQVAVLDAKIAVLYVDGYPRWEYRYIKNEMIRDKSVEISCLLTSADPSFAQEGDRPIRRFPESIQELLEYDVVLFGDVDPRQFTDAQLQLVADFVSQKGGGFGMVAGPRWSPSAFRNTAIEPILPVNISRVEPESLVQSGTIAEGFRPMLTKVGEASSIFRFFADRARNASYMKEELPVVFWYCRGITVKPGVGEVYAEHPSDTGPDARKAPILVLGRFGAGRTLFSAIDDSWRWRFYTGESVFDTYWVQQLRYLARSKKLGQRRMTLTSFRPVYELGEQVRVSLRILDPQLLQQLPEQIRVQVEDEAGQVIRHETLMRQESQTELYQASWTADRVGRFVLKLPPIASGTDAADLPIEVAVPRLELVSPQVDRTLLTRIASETLGRALELKDAPALPQIIPSAAKIIPVDTNAPLWDAPLVMAVFLLLITAEWILRKAYGML